MTAIDYGNPVTRIRACETGLLDQSRFNRLLQVSRVEEMLKVLKETEYGAHIDRLESINDYEEMLEDELSRVHLLLQELIKNPLLKQIITLPNDLHNLKVLLKSRQLDEVQSQLFQPRGQIEIEELTRLVEEEDWNRISEHLGKGLAEALLQLKEETDPQQVELLLDRAQYKILLRLAKKMGSSLLEGLFIKKIDLLNIEITIRIKAMGGDKELLRQALLPGGDIDPDLLLKNLNEPLSSLAGSLARSDYGQLVAEGIEYLQKKESLTGYEKMADDFLMKYVQQSRFIHFGPEPIYSYLWVKEKEIENLRIILIGRHNNLPETEIRERLRDLNA